MSYAIHLLILAALFVPLTVSLRLLGVTGGLPFFAQAVFFAAGAYGYALLCLRLDWAPTLSLLCAVLMSIPISVAVAAVCLHFRGEVFLLVSLAIQMVMSSLLTNLVPLTNGPFGLSGISSLFDGSSTWLLKYAALSVGMAAFGLMLFARLDRSAFGLALRAARDSEPFALSIGYDVQGLRALAVVLCACPAALSGGVFAAYVGYIDPSSFTLQEGILLYAVVLVAGSSMAGIVAGTVLFLLLPEALRFVGIAVGSSDQIRTVLFGLVLILVPFVRPAGLTKLVLSR